MWGALVSLPSSSTGTVAHVGKPAIPTISKKPVETSLPAGIMRIVGQSGPIWVATSDAVLSAQWEPVSYTHLRAHETVLDLVCRLLLEKKKKKLTTRIHKKTIVANILT